MSRRQTAFTRSWRLLRCFEGLRDSHTATGVRACCDDVHQAHSGGWHPDSGQPAARKSSGARNPGPGVRYRTVPSAWGRRHHEPAGRRAVGARQSLSCGCVGAGIATDHTKGMDAALEGCPSPHRPIVDTLSVHRVACESIHYKQENPQGAGMAQPGGFLKRRLAMTYSPTARSCSTIGVRGLNFQVRNGFGWVPPTIVTSQKRYIWMVVDVMSALVVEIAT